MNDMQEEPVANEQQTGPHDEQREVDKEDALLRIGKVPQGGNADAHFLASSLGFMSSAFLTTFLIVVVGVILMRGGMDKSALVLAPVLVAPAVGGLLWCAGRMWSPAFGRGAIVGALVPSLAPFLLFGACSAIVG